MRRTGCTTMGARIPILVLALLQASFAAGAQAAQWRTLQLEGGLELRLLEMEPNRSTPSDYVQQGIETIEARGRERVLLARPLGSLGGEPRILYSLLAQADRTPSPLVRISGQVLVGQRAFTWQAQVGSDRWQQSVLEIVEALAQLPARHAAQSGLLDPDRAIAPVTFTASAITFERLAGPVTVDGRNWLAANVVWPGGRAVAPDGLFELTLVEVDELALQYGIEPYVSPQAVSPDGRRVVFSRRDCAVDCAGVATEYFMLTLPRVP